MACCWPSRWLSIWLSLGHLGVPDSTLAQIVADTFAKIEKGCGPLSGELDKPTEAGFTHSDC